MLRSYRKGFGVDEVEHAAETVQDSGIPSAWFFMLGGPGGHGTFPPKGSGNPTLHLTVYVDDVDAHCESARAAGAAILAEPEDKFWGDRCYEALDLEGPRWRFHQHTGRKFAFRERD